MAVHYFMYDEKTKRVQGFGTVSGEVWDTHQKVLADRNLTMVPIWDMEQLAFIRSEQPQNVRVNENWQLEAVPEPERNKAAEVIVIADDQLMLLNQKMNVMLTLLRGLPQAMAEAMKELWK